MASLNKVFLMGNLTRNPELRYTPGGSAVCEMGLAVNRRYTLGNGETKDETTFVDIVVWGKQGESAQRYLQKGSGVFVEGRLVYDSWTEKDTQKKRSRLRVVAERLQFVGRRDDAGAGAPAEGPAYDGEGSQAPQQPQQHASRPPQAPRPQGQGGYGGQQRQQPPQGGYQQRPASAPRAQDAPPAMPKDDPFEVVEGVDDDIPF